MERFFKWYQNVEKNYEGKPLMKSATAEDYKLYDLHYKFKVFQEQKLEDVLGVLIPEKLYIYEIETNLDYDSYDVMTYSYYTKSPERFKMEHVNLWVTCDRNNSLYEFILQSHMII